MIANGAQTEGPSAVSEPPRSVASPGDGLAKAGHVSPQEKLRQLRRLGAEIFACGPSMEHFGVASSDLAFDDAIVAEYLTFMEQMDRADIHLCC